jgi:predicted transporter
MTILGSHVVLMFLYAVAAGLFFALLWKKERADRIRLFVIIFCSLFLGAVILSWLMYPFPMK